MEKIRIEMDKEALKRIVLAALAWQLRVLLEQEEKVGPPTNELLDTTIG